MSRYAAAIADLERRHDLITGALKALYALEALGDDAAGIVKSRAGLPPVSPKPRPVAPARSQSTPGPKPGTRHGLKVTAEGWKRARPMWDADDSAEKIGKEIGCSGARVNQYAKEKGWPVRDYSAIARKARLKTLAPAGDGRPGAKPFVPKPRVTGTPCPKCHIISPADPCYDCGTPKAKK